jgi:hypothetical protein
MGGWDRKGYAMQRVDGNYLYTVGAQIHPIAMFSGYSNEPGKPGTTMAEAHFPLLIAEGAIDPLLSRSVFRLKTSVQAGHALLATIRRVVQEIQDEQDKSKTLGYYDIYLLTSQLTTFEAVLAAELALLPLYVVTQKAGFDTSILIDNGAQCFPAELMFKVPDAMPDLQQATKCIAFEVPTAAGFHLHRANEAVLRKYWDAVTDGAKRPKSRNMGDYLVEMDKRNVGNDKVKAALRHLKDFHRNPLIHPEDVLTTDEAIALMNSVHTVLVQMLREIPIATQIPPAPPAGSVIPSTTSEIDPLPVVDEE